MFLVYFQLFLKTLTRSINCVYDFNCEYIGDGKISVHML
jgi:hypothetical protein